MKEMQLFDQLVSGDDISWQAMIFDAVRSQQMDPWDIDISDISERFMQLMSSMKEMNLRVPGKVILASAILLKFKSHRFITSDMNALDRLIAETEYVEDDYVADEDDDDYDITADMEVDGEIIPPLVPRTPQPRKRKVSVYDLVKALEKALEVKNRRVILQAKPHPKVELPNKLVDLNMVIKDVYNSLVQCRDQRGSLTFSQIIPSDARHDIVYTFIPLLHLTNMRKIDLHQEQHFGDIAIEILSEQKSISETDFPLIEEK